MIEVLIFLASLFALLFWRARKPSRLPPGFPRLPIIGSLPFLRKFKTSFMLMQDIGKLYGPICSFYIGNSLTVVLNDLEDIKTVMKMEEASERPKMKMAATFRYGDPLTGEGIKGILFSSGPEWRDQRRFALKHLKDFGFGKSSMQSMITHEAVKLKNHLKTDVGKVTSLDSTLNISILSALWVILVGEEMDLDDKKLHAVVQSVLQTVTGKGVSNVVQFLLSAFPWLFKMFPSLIPEDTSNMFAHLKGLMKTVIKEHRDTFDENNLRDFLDVHIKEQLSAQKGSSFHGEKGIQHEEMALIDLFLAGSETTSTTITWAILYFLHHPEVLARVHEEMDQVIGRDRLPELKDEASMPYFSAVIHEIHRCASVVFLGIPHCTSASVEVSGYIIPRGTRVMANLHQVMRNPEVFPDPETFNPDRFLDENGQFTPNPHVIPFLVGKRICLGMTLAEKELFLFLSTLVQAFDFKIPEGYELPSYKEYERGESSPNGFIRFCPKYQLILQERSSF